MKDDTNCVVCCSHLTQTTTWEDPRKKLLQQQIQQPLPTPPQQQTMVAPPLHSAVTAPAAGITVHFYPSDMFHNQVDNASVALILKSCRT